MLAITPKTDTYLSAKELGITNNDLKILIEVRNDLAAGKFKHSSTRYLSRNFKSENNDKFFNMEHWKGKYECGTVHCIGGFMSLYGAFNKDYNFPDSFKPLFYPPNNLNWNNLTVEQAVRAIDFWATGNQNNCWELAVTEDSNA